MDQSAALIETIAIRLGAAFLGGIVAYRLRLPTIVGYMLAGVAVGPFTPGLVADTGTASEIAELGVSLTGEVAPWLLEAGERGAIRPLASQPDAIQALDTLDGPPTERCDGPG